MTRLISITQFIHKYFFVILLSAYGLAAIMPGPGLFLRDLSFGQISLFNADTLNVSPSLLMLSLLLFNAGIGTKLQELKHLASKPALPFFAFIANALVPIILIFVLHGAMSAWHDQDELQNLLTGLALIVAMPIAGASTAWSQNANGNLSLSLGLVLLSTLLSPITSPIILHTFGLITMGDYSEDLHELAQQGTTAFMSLTVVIPAVAGIILHTVLGENRIAKSRPLLKLANFVLILALNYANAARALPQVLKNPDIDFLIFIIVVTTAMCLISFGAGWALSKVMKTDNADMAALMFGLGMNNNGTGLVLAASALADHPMILLPMIFYTLIQQVIAAAVDWKFFRNEENLCSGILSQ